MAYYGPGDHFAAGQALFDPFARGNTSGAMQKQQRQQLIAEQLSHKDADEYAEDILQFMHEQELKSLPCVASIDIQTEIEWFMRPYLLDFLIEAHAAFGLQEETLFLAVNILDRYCSKRVVYRKHYQLVGCTALLIASKYGECSKKVPHVKELAGMCCSLYDEDMFIQMERHIMMTLDWYIGAPTVDGFLQAAMLDGPCDPEVEHMALYIAQIALFHRDFVSKRTSELAKASLALARIVLNRPQPPAFHWVSDFESATLVALSQHLHRPSPILLQKFCGVPLSKVAMTLEDFLTRHAAIARCTQASAGPLTPPAESTLPSNANDVAGTVMSTPQKGPRPDLVNGCLTPPITPDSEQFYNFDARKQQQQFPDTPNSDPNHLGLASYHHVPQICVQPAV